MSANGNAARVKHRGAALIRVGKRIRSDFFQNILFFLTKSLELYIQTFWLLYNIENDEQKMFYTCWGKQKEIINSFLALLLSCDPRRKSWKKENLITALPPNIVWARTKTNRRLSSWSWNLVISWESDLKWSLLVSQVLITLSEYWINWSYVRFRFHPSGGSTARTFVYLTNGTVLLVACRKTGVHTELFICTLFAKSPLFFRVSVSAILSSFLSPRLLTPLLLKVNSSFRHSHNTHFSSKHIVLGSPFFYFYIWTRRSPSEPAELGLDFYVDKLFPSK